MLCLYIHYRKEGKVVPLAKAQGWHRTRPARALHPVGYNCKGSDGELVVTNRRRDKQGRW